MDLTKFLSWEFLLAALAINAVMTVLKLMGDKYKPMGKYLAKPWMQAFVMTPLPLVLGVLLAAVPDWLVPAGTAGWYIVGMVVGFLSQFLYAVFKKRIETSTGTDFDGDGKVG